MKFNHLLEILLAGDDLGTELMTEVMRAIMAGELSEARTAAFLVALRQKGESADEIATAAAVMREYATVVASGQSGLVDTCGTGGDGIGTFNISTTSALVAAAAGVTVAKHGNRSISGSSGSADFLEAAGVNLALNPEQIVRCINEIGIGFLFAPKLHSAMKNVANVRRELGVRTLFNLLGPLTNPAGADTQLIGVFDSRWLTPVADAAKKLSIVRAMVVHSEDGLDEISVSAPTQVAELKDGTISSYTLTPADFGVVTGRLDEICIDDVTDSLEMALGVLRGQQSVAHDIVVVNAGAVIYLSGQASNLLDGAQQAVATIASGAALAKFEQLLALSRSFGES